jgi:hypothetical protein
MNGQNGQVKKARAKSKQKIEKEQETPKTETVTGVEREVFKAEAFQTQMPKSEEKPVADELKNHGATSASQTFTKEKAETQQPSEKKVNSKNPLFIVTNKGQDVELLERLGDLFKGKRSLQDWWQVTQSIIQLVQDWLKGALYLQFVLSWLEQSLRQWTIVQDNMKVMMAMFMPNVFSFFKLPSQKTS